MRIRKLRAEPIAKIKISELRSKHMADYRDRRLAGDPTTKPVSGSTVNRELNLLGHVLNVAKKEWGIHVPVNPVSEIGTTQREPGALSQAAPERRTNTSEEERLLAELELKPQTASGAYAIGGCRNEYARPTVMLAIKTAMWRSELLRRHWQDVHLTERYVRLHDSKNGEPRDVPLSTRAVRILAELAKKPRDASGRVLLISPEALKKAFTCACERANIKDLHFHDLRHEATSRIAERLDNVLELSAVTCHRQLQMLKRYYHPRASDLALKLGRERSQIGAVPG